jgi:hypothetical protein
MYSTTPDFDAAAIATIRQPRARITITWADPYIDTGVSIASNGESNISDNLHIADTILESNYKWFLFENNQLNGDYCLLPEPHQSIYQVGWYGNELSDGSGEFTTDPYITIDFTERPIYGFIIAGENTLNQYPVDFTVQIYSGVSLEYTKMVYGNTDLVYQDDNAYVASADSMKLTIHKWSETSATVKILEFYSSIIKVYEGETIKSISLLEEREIRDSTTPIGNISSNEVTVVLQNILVDGVIDPFFPGNTDSNLHLLLKPGRKVEIEIGFLLSTGFNEYIPMGTFWSGDFIIKENSPTISFTARDRMEQLRKYTYDDNELSSSTSFLTFIRSIVQSANEKIPQLSYDIGGGFVLLDIPIAFMDRVSYFEALKKIAAATGGQVYISKDDVLIFETAEYAYYYSGGIDLFITKSQYFSKDQPSRYEEIINKIEIETQPLVISSGTSTVYESDESIDLPASATLDPIEIKYNSFPISGVTDLNVTLSGTGCTPVLDDAEYFSWGCILTISNSAGTNGTFTIEITGYTYELIGNRIVTSKDDASIVANGEKVYRLPNNHLLQSFDVAQSIADELITSYADPRNDLTLDWRGNPALELGDTIVIPEYGSNQGVFKVYKLQTEYDGTLRQTISARRIETYIP